MNTIKNELEAEEYDYEDILIEDEWLDEDVEEESKDEEREVKGEIKKRKKDKKKKITMRNSGYAYTMLHILFFEKMVRLKDFRAMMRVTYTGNISNSIKKLTDYGFVKVENDVISITRKGEVYVMDKEGGDSYEDEHYIDILKEYKKASKKGRESRYLDFKRGSAMMHSQRIIKVFPKDKPSLVELAKKIGVQHPNLDKAKPSSSYKPVEEIPTQELARMYANGIYYTKSEVIEALSVLRNDIVDLIRSSRAIGLFINAKKIVVIYVQPNTSENMFQINHGDVLLKQFLTAFFFNDSILPVTRSTLECVVFSDGESLVWSMATGWKSGRITEGRKKMMLNMFRNYTNTSTNAVQSLNETTGHVLTNAFKYPDISQNIEDIDKVKEASNIIHSSLSAANSCLCYANNIYDKLYVVPVTIKGVAQLTDILYYTENEIGQRGLKLLKQYDINAEQDAYIPLQYKSEGRTILYMPYYEVMLLHRTSCDGDLAQTRLLPPPAEESPVHVITKTDMTRAISHSMRRNIIFLDVESLKEIPNTVLYNMDGYVRPEYPDQYRAKRKQKENKVKKKRYKEAKITVYFDESEKKEFERIAAQHGISMNKLLKNIIRNGIKNLDQ